MMLLGLHIFAISALIVVVGGIAYQMGKTEGIRITKSYFEAESQKKEHN